MFPSSFKYLKIGLTLSILPFYIVLVLFSGIHSGILRIELAPSLSLYKSRVILSKPFFLQDKILIHRKNTAWGSPWHTKGEPRFFEFKAYESELWPEDILRVAEQMPRFPGCEKMTDRHERKTCSDKNLLAFIYGNLTLPECYRVRCAHHTGTAVVSFIVEKDGSMSDMKLIRDPGHGLGDSALAAVQKIQEQAIRWAPGKQDGKLVRIQMNVPVRFHLE